MATKLLFDIKSIEENLKNIVVFILKNGKDKNLNLITLTF